MATLIIPQPDETPWPTLGPQVCDWIEANLVYGPGDLRGEPYQIEPEFRALIYRMYEVVPRGMPGEGRRRFKRCAFNVRKGTGKTEKAAILAAAELHPDAPVRCDGWDADGEPVGISVTDPYVALVAYTQEQTEELGFNVLRTVLSEGPLADDFDIGLERILVLDSRGRAAGKAVPLTGAPNARDGARTTFQHFDETHRMTSERLMRAHTTMLENTYKRVAAEPWSLETTTMFDPSERSVAAETHAYATEVSAGRMRDSKLFYFYRHAPESMSLESMDDVKVALLEASGPAADWSADLDGLASRWFEPGTDRQYFRRVWLNQLVAGRGAAFDAVRWAELADIDHVVPDRSKITVGFDGARTRDGTALVACELSTGYMWLAGYWQNPLPDDPDEEWEVPTGEVDQVVDALFDRYKVVRMYADPYFWTSEVDSWMGRYGERVVVSYATTALRRIGMAVQGFAEAIRAGSISHDGSSILTEHVGNAVRVETQLRGDADTPLYKIEKERRGSPRKIDAAMAAVLAFDARSDCIAAGLLKSSGRVASFN
jgi:phage terminase large subunit-like protein